MKNRDEKLQQIVKNMTFRETVEYLGSRTPLSICKVDGKIQRYSTNTRNDSIVSSHKYRSVKNNGGMFNNVSYSGDFFESFAKLYREFPHPSLLFSKENKNSDFSDMTVASNNCYLSFVAVRSENIAYSFNVKDGTNVFGSVNILENSSNIYNCTKIINSHNVFYSSKIRDSSDIWYSTGLTNCTHCRECSNLEHQSYCYQNKQYEKEQYLKLIKVLDKPDGDAVVPSGISNPGSTNCTGSDRCINCEDLESSYNCFNLHGGKNNFFASSSKGSHTRYGTFLTGNANEVYLIQHSGGYINNSYFAIDSNKCSRIYYSFALQDCSYCLGCLGLKNKSYCIFNTQYEKEEWYEEVDRIFTQMEKDGQFGKFFSGSMNPFYFNDTAAYQSDPSFTKEEMIQKGYLWRDDAIRVDISDSVEVVSTQDLGEYEKPYTHEILKKVIQDDQGNAYRITKMEYDFIVFHGLPFPRKHWHERMKSNFKIQ